MKDEIIYFTYGELINAFNNWGKLLDAGEVPERPVGNNFGEMFCNYLITTVNKDRESRKKA